jgi:GT2 family glycosyltransferase
MIASIQSQPMTAAGAARIALVMATYKRPAVVERLVGSLASEAEVVAVCVVDNGSDNALKASLEKLDRRVRCLDAGANLGCGGGLALGCREALRDTSVTHLWIVDDDVVIVPGCAARLLKAMVQARAEVAVPLLAGPDGKIISYPGPLQGPAWREIRRPITPEQFMAVCGPAPLDFVWSPGACLLVTRRAAVEAGGPRTEYWLMGEDLEYTCRLSARYRAILAPEARALHWQPSQNRDAQYVKSCAMLTNAAYTIRSFSHGRRLLRHLPGNCFHFLEHYGFSPGNLCQVLRSLYWGAVCRLPAGSSRFQQFRSDYFQGHACR